MRAFAARTRRRVLSAIVRTRLRIAGIVAPESCDFYGLPVVTISPGSNIELGERVALVSKSSKTALGVNHPVVLRTLAPGAQIVIGDDVGISGGSICAAARITIGSGTLLGANVTIADTDFHPLDSIARRYAARPIASETDRIDIGQNVFLGTGSTILKGTSIGDNSVVGAGSVVKGVFPANVILAGNPARVVREMDL